MAKLVTQFESREGEAEKIRAWRIDVCKELGFDVTCSELIADSPADLHQLAQMIHRGCPLATALRIVV